MSTKKQAKSKQPDPDDPVTDEQRIHVVIGAGPTDVAKKALSAPALSGSLKKQVLDITRPKQPPMTQPGKISPSTDLAQRLKGVNAAPQTSVATAPKTVTPGLIAMTSAQPPLVTPTSIPAVPTESEEPLPAELPDPSLDDALSDAAVDAITAADADTVLEIEDSAAARRPPIAQSTRHGIGWIFKRKLTYVLLLLCLIAAVCAIPVTRYKLLGLVIKRSYSITIIDAATKTPISDVDVMIHNQHGHTDAAGKITFSVPVGPAKVVITKHYYQMESEKVTVGLHISKQPTVVKLIATGRQVPLMVINQLTGQPVSGAEVAALGTTAKTASDGRATIVLPTKQERYPVTISAPGFNQRNAMIDVQSLLSSDNSFGLIVAGRVYALQSSLNKLNVLSVNLDGSNPKTVVYGTGAETDATSRLYNSSDWRYLMLFTRRNAATASGLYLINSVSNNDLTTVEEDTNTITPIGWSAHSFIYLVQNNAQPNYQPSYYELKSYDADTGHTTTLDQSDALGSQSDYAYQTFGNFFITDGKLLYSKLWQGSVDTYENSNVTSSINSISADGQNQEPYQQFPMTSSGSIVSAIKAAAYGSGKVYFDASFTAGPDQYFSYADNSLMPVTIDAGTFADADYRGVVSPSGELVENAAIKGGKYVITTTSLSSTTSSAKTVASLPISYHFYGWYSDAYMLVSSDDTIYIIPANGAALSQEPIKITSYIEP